MGQSEQKGPFKCKRRINETVWPFKCKRTINETVWIGRTEKTDTVTYSFNKKTEQAINKYKTEVEGKIGNATNIEEVNQIIKESKENNLYTQITKTTKLINKKDQIWMTKEIRKEIANRRKINKEARKEKKQELEVKYKNQKIK